MGSSPFFFTEIVACVSVHVDKKLSVNPSGHKFWTIATASDLAYSVYVLRMYSDENGEKEELEQFWKQSQQKYENIKKIWEVTKIMRRRQLQVN